MFGIDIVVLYWLYPVSYLSACREREGKAQSTVVDHEAIDKRMPIMIELFRTLVGEGEAQKIWKNGDILKTHNQHVDGSDACIL